LIVGPDVPLAVAAAVALGSPGNHGAVEPLTRALRSTDARLAMAAIRGLGRVRTPEAIAAIREAASSHPNQAVRRRAEAEMRLLSPP
jgi:HEAT repeat protein